MSVVASDGTLSGTNRFTVTVNGVNDAPGIAVIPDQHALEGIPLTVNFTVTDVDTALTSLSVTASSSNDALVPDANVVPGGAGGNRSLTITSLGQSGTSTITVNVSDGQGGTASRSFVLTVEPVNTLPTLAPIGNVVITRSNGVSSVTVPLTGIGSGSASENQVLNVTASSDNHAILPNPVVTYTSPGTTGSLQT